MINKIFSILIDQFNIKLFLTFIFSFQNGVLVCFFGSESEKTPNLKEPFKKTIENTK